MKKLLIPFLVCCQLSIQAQVVFTRLDINPGTADGVLGNRKASYKGKLYFDGYDKDSLYGLMVSDGTIGGTKCLRSLTIPENFAEANGLLFFRAETFANGIEL